MKIVATLLLVSISLAVSAQDSVRTATAAKALDFKEAVRLGLQNNVILKQQQNNLRLNRANKTFAMGQLGPQASINASGGINNGNYLNPNKAEVVNATVDRMSASLTVQMPIFNGLSGINTLNQANNQLDAQYAQVIRATQDAINTITIQFLQVLLDQELLKIAQENLQLQTKQLEQVNAQVELGSRSPVDGYNQQALTSNAELQVVQAELALTNDRTTLFQTLLIDPTENIVVDEPSWDVNSIAIDTQTFDQLMDLARAHRSDLKQAVSTEKASLYGMRATFGNFLPSLNAQYTFGSAYNQVRGTPRDTSYRDFANQFRLDNRAQSIGLSLNIPIFTGFRNRYTYVQSKVAYQNNKLLTQNREIIVKGDVVRAYENFNSIKKGYTVSLTGLEASQMAYNLEKERYDLGVTSFVDMATANRTFVQAQTTMAQAKYRFLFQKIVLDYAVGTLKFEDIP